MAGIHLVSGQNRGDAPRGLEASPVEEPDLLGAGQSLPELLLLRGVHGAPVLVPGELPLLPPAGGHGLAVDDGAQVGVDAESHTQAPL